MDLDVARNLGGDGWVLRDFSGSLEGDVVMSNNSIDATRPDLSQMECLASAWWFKN
jgi:hypothetical protein